MYAEGEQTNGLFAYNSNHIFNDMDLIDSKGEFVVAHEVPSLHVDVILYFSYNIVVVMEKEDHQGLLLSPSTDLDVHMDILLVSSLLVLVCH